MNNNFFNKLVAIGLFISILFSMSANSFDDVNASSGMLRKNTIIKCNNKYYGQHSNPAHWHQATKDGYAIYPALKKVGNCKFKPISSSTNNEVYNFKKINVSLKKVTDGDTATFSKVGKVRFLMIDTPEMSTHQGHVAKKYTESLLKKAKKISVKYDVNANKMDRYKRSLMWIYVDGELLQKKIAQKGYVIKYYTKNGKTTRNWQDVKLEAKNVKQVSDNLFKKKGYWIQ